LSHYASSRKDANQFQTTALQRNKNKSLQLEPSSSCNRFFSINLSFNVSDMYQSVTLRFAAQLCLASRHLHAAALYQYPAEEPSKQVLVNIFIVPTYRFGCCGFLKLLKNGSNCCFGFTRVDLLREVGKLLPTQ
jgi:hypothetical protein